MAFNFNLSPEMRAVIKQIAEQADEETFAPFADKLGMSPSALTGLLKALPVILSDDFDFKKLIPTVLPMLASYFLSGGKKTDDDKKIPYDTLTPAESHEKFEVEEVKAFSDSQDLYLQSEIL